MRFQLVFFPVVRHKEILLPTVSSSVAWVSPQDGIEITLLHEAKIQEIVAKRSGLLACNVIKRYDPEYLGLRDDHKSCPLGEGQSHTGLAVIVVPLGGLEVLVHLVLAAHVFAAAGHPFVRVAKVGAHVHFAVVEVNLRKSRVKKRS